MPTWYVYLLRCADDTLYCGVTTDVKRRIDQHNSGTGAKYTRSRTPVSLEACVSTKSRSDALRLEIKVKKQPRYKKINFLLEHMA
ncbi:GIY-YIG nuclease family protein [Pseudodesulfovibrio cashew]|uniref:GIY-YIG nuclease family protein n=1 Tax=Pseudodesulfovibrio cashew TaxID=2678688 RepID=A0A6I6JDN6_9BACT|nr:GIY-YIG nuclease family protein [Pseudodesulfovibrio cashew]QGY40956.1 GIY-YIG nuclease family protein [Pseudodesulfovibrio cashew]